MLIIIGIIVLALTIIIGKNAIGKKRWWLFTSQVALVAGILLVFCVLLPLHRNPYRKLGIQFLEDNPGASGRYVTYTPVLLANRSVVAGPEIGADHGILRFRDLDGDGYAEIIVESSALGLMFDGSGQSRSRQVLKYIPEAKAGQPRFRIVKE